MGSGLPIRPAPRKDRTMYQTPSRNELTDALTMLSDLACFLCGRAIYYRQSLSEAFSDIYGQQPEALELEWLADIASHADDSSISVYDPGAQHG